MCIRDRISVAIITYCLVAIVQYDMQLNRSTYEVLQILSISLTDKTHLQEDMRIHIHCYRNITIPMKYCNVFEFIPNFAILEQ